MNEHSTSTVQASLLSIDVCLFCCSDLVSSSSTRQFILQSIVYNQISLTVATAVNR